MNTTKKRKILVTNGLTYANASLHLGHMVGYIQADIWTRFQKMRGNECIYLCGSDCHGTPVMLRAEQENIDPEVLVENIQQEQAKDVSDFLVELDNFYTTHSEENHELVNMIFERLEKRGDIISKSIEQAFDPVKNLFLPDRYVKGTCPRCGATNQYGDNCEVCSATYSPTELKDPVSVISGATPITKSSEHYFFQLPHYTDALKTWTQAGHLQEQVVNKLTEWFDQGLQNWDISRDAPYFGFEIPNHPGKYFYVWLDAPIGYIATLKNLLLKRPDLTLEEFWNNDAKTELYHFIGKDIMYFHALFWPAMLMSADLRTPSTISVHGFLTINGQKMSKSRGTFILARQYLQYFDPEYFRYYIASKLSTQVEDVDLNLEDFGLKINSDLVGKVVNIASRCAGFIHKYFDDRLSPICAEPELFKTFSSANKEIANAYEEREFSKAVREIMKLADLANQYIDDKKPWKLIKEENQKENVHAVCSMGLNLFRILALYLKPILPLLAEKTETFLNITPLSWEDSETCLTKHKINQFQPMMQRIEKTAIEALIKTITTENLM